MYIQIETPPTSTLTPWLRGLRVKEDVLPCSSPRHPGEKDTVVCVWLKPGQFHPQLLGVSDWGSVLDATQVQSRDWRMTRCIVNSTFSHAFVHDM